MSVTRNPDAEAALRLTSVSLAWDHPAWKLTGMDIDMARLDLVPPVHFDPAAEGVVP